MKKSESISKNNNLQDLNKLKGIEIFRKDVLITIKGGNEIIILDKPIMRS